MIINIRGTSGSGKSTVVREVMKMYEYKLNVMQTEPKRKQPISYSLGNHPIDTTTELTVIGHYETPCGGCDTINKQADIFRLVREADDAGHDVVFEGLLISAEVRNTAALHDEGRDLVVIGLNKVPVDLCLDSVNGRRQAKTPGAPDVKPGNTIAKFRGVELSMKRLSDAGVNVMSADRKEALDFALLMLGLVK